MERPQAVFFDLGHTLISGAAQSPRRLLAASLDLDDKTAARVGKLIMTHPAETPETLCAALEPLLPDHPPDRIRGGVERIWEEQIACVRALPGAEATLIALRRAGITVGAISNIWHPFYLGFQHRCPELHGLIDQFTLSYRVGIKKPAPELFRLALEQTGAAAARCWMVGDSFELDLTPAARLGIHNLWVLCRPERERAVLVEMLRGLRPGPEAVVESIAEVAPLILNRGGEA